HSAPDRCPPPVPTRRSSDLHDLDVVDFERKDHVHEALVAAVDIARDAVDQHLDAIDIAFAVEGPERHLARLGAHAGLGELDAGQDRKSTRLNSSHVKISYAV